MTRTHGLIPQLALGLALLSQAYPSGTLAAEAFNIQPFGVSVVVDRDGDRDVDSTIVSGSQFHGTHHAAVGLATSDATYELSWSNDFGHFLIQNNQTVPDVTGVLWARSRGEVHFITTQDVLLNLSASFSYHIPGPEYESFLSVIVRDNTSPGIPCTLCYSDAQGPVWLDPPNGTMSTSLQNALLPANHSFYIIYEFKTTTGHGGTSVTGTSNGRIEWTFTAVPEPATLILLTIAAPLMAQRRRGRHRPC